MSTFSRIRFVFCIKFSNMQAFMSSIIPSDENKTPWSHLVILQHSFFTSLWPERSGLLRGIRFTVQAFPLQSTSAQFPGQLATLCPRGRCAGDSKNSYWIDTYINEELYSQLQHLHNYHSVIHLRFILQYPGYKLFLNPYLFYALTLPRLLKLICIPSNKLIQAEKDHLL